MTGQQGFHNHYVPTVAVWAMCWCDTALQEGKKIAAHCQSVHALVVVQCLVPRDQLLSKQKPEDIPAALCCIAKQAQHHHHVAATVLECRPV